MKIKHLLAICLLSTQLTSCGKSDTSLVAVTRHFENAEVDAGILRQEAGKRYGGNPISITAYRWPKVEDLTFTSVAFPSLSSNERVSAIADLVANLGPDSDKLDEKIYTNRKLETEISESVAAKIKAELGIEECWEADNAEQEARCKEIYAESETKINTLKAEYQTLIGEKSALTQRIVQEFDADLGTPSNWIKYDSSSAVHNIVLPSVPDAGPVKFDIVLKLIPNQADGLLYSLDNNSIRNFKYTYVPSNGATLLTFDLYEMSSQGVFTGNRYEFKLRKKILPSVGMRLRGDFKVFRANSTTHFDQGMYKLILSELK